MLTNSVGADYSVPTRVESAETCLRCKVAWDRTWGFCGECGHKKSDYAPPALATPIELNMKDTSSAGLNSLYGKSSKGKVTKPLKSKHEVNCIKDASQSIHNSMNVTSTAGMMSRKDFENDAKLAELSNINARNTELYLHLAQSDKCRGMIPTPILGSASEAKNCANETSFAPLSQSQSQGSLNAAAAREWQVKQQQEGSPSPSRRAVPSGSSVVGAAGTASSKRRQKLSDSIRSAHLANSKMPGGDSSPTKHKSKTQSSSDKKNIKKNKQEDAGTRGVTDDYLSSVGSVGSLYADYVQREKMFAGLKAVSTERLDTEVSMHYNSANTIRRSSGSSSSGGTSAVGMNASSAQSAAWFWGKHRNQDQLGDDEEGKEDEEEEEEEEEDDVDSRADCKESQVQGGSDFKGRRNGREENIDAAVADTDADTDADAKAGDEADEQRQMQGCKTTGKKKTTTPKTKTDGRSGKKGNPRKPDAAGASGGVGGGLGILWSPMEAAMYQDSDSEDENGDDDKGDRVSIDSGDVDDDSNDDDKHSHASQSLASHSQTSDAKDHDHDSNVLSAVASSRRHSSLARSGSNDSLDSKHSSDILFEDQHHNYNDMIPTAFRGNKMPSSILSKHFQRSIRRSKAVLEECFEMDYRRDVMRMRHVLSRIFTSIEALEEAQTYAREQVDQAEVEYETIQAELESKRRDSAMRVATSYEKITSVHAKFAERYNRAQESFDAHQAAQEEQTGLKSHIKSSAKMDKIQKAADAQLGKCGEALQLLQNNEAILLKNLREAEHTLLESIRHWRPKYLEWKEKVLSKLTLLKALRIDIASRKIQWLFQLARDQRRQQRECAQEWQHYDRNGEGSAYVMYYELTFCRHGESNGNAAGISMGHTPGFLTSKGRKQAKQLNSTLCDLFPNLDVLDGIYCSDLQRVIETCEIALRRNESGGCIKGDCSGSDIPLVADFLSHMNRVVQSPLLREKNAGVFEGRPRKEQEAARIRHGDDRLFCCEGGESWNDVLERVVQFTAQVQGEHAFTPKKKYTESVFNCFSQADIAATSAVQVKKILVFTSGGVIKEFINAFVYKTNTPSAAASSFTKYYPNKAVNCSTFMFRCTADFSDVKMVVENHRPALASEVNFENFVAKDKQQEQH